MCSERGSFETPWAAFMLLACGGTIYTHTKWSEHRGMREREKRETLFGPRFESPAGGFATLVMGILGEFAKITRA